jgi:Flp pilus assembly protein TadG
MKFLTRQHAPFAKMQRKGQILVIFALLLPILVLMCGLAIDLGILYLADARLSRSLDSTALRLSQKPSIDLARRKALALTTLKANYPNFLKNKTVADWVVTGTVTGSTGEVMTITDSTTGESAKVTTKGSGATTFTYKPVDVINTTVEASVRQPTFFIRLAGDGLKTVDFKRVATAKRYPAVIAIVLDISGSMLEQENTGNFPTSNTRADGLLAAVAAFVPYFDDTRDFMIAVAYSRTAAVIWPPSEDDDDIVSDGYFFPCRQFNTGLGGNANKKLSTWLNNNMRWYGSTNAYEGMRVAAKNVKAMLDTYPVAIRDQIQVNYVLMTDGEFNTVSSYARGPGFGYPWNNPGGTATVPSARPTWLPSKYDFHMDPLLVGDLSVATTVPIPDYTSGAASGFTSYDLSVRAAPTTLVGTVGGNSIPRGVRGVVDGTFYSPTDSTTMVWKHSYGNHGTSPLTPTYDLPSAIPANDLTTGVYPTSATAGIYPRGSGEKANGINNDGTTNDSSINRILYPVNYQLDTSSVTPPFIVNPTSPPYWRSWNYPANFFYKSGASNAAVGGDPYVDVTTDTAAPVGTGTDTQKTRYRLVYEKAKMFRINMVGFPGTIFADAMNPFKNTSSPRYRSSAGKNLHDPDGVMTNAFTSYFPGTRRYANTYGVYFLDTYGGYNSSGNTVNWVKPSVSPNSVAVKDRYGIGTMAISDFYPDFTASGQLDAFKAPVPFTNGGSGTNAGDSLYYTNNLSTLVSGGTSGTYPNWDPVRTNIDDTDNRMNWKDWWSMRSNAWSTSAPGNTDAYWLVEAQCWLVRSQQKATVYTVDYSATYSNAMRRMANDNNGSPFADYAVQKTGKYFDVSSSGNAGLISAFEEIAARISLKLVQ